MFAPRKTPKAIRVLTVLAYMLSVSLAAIMLSLYYVFLWRPETPPAARRVAEPPPCQPGLPQAYMQTQALSATPTKPAPSSSVPPVIEYLTRLNTSAQPTVNTTGRFLQTSGPLHGT